MMDFVAERVDGRARLLAGTNATTTNEVIELSRHAQEKGYEGVMLAAPYYSLPTADELAVHFRTVAEAVEAPILLSLMPKMFSTGRRASSTPPSMSTPVRAGKL